MKIKSLDIPAGYMGLNAVRMAELGPVVLLAGPNGGGKTRVLRAAQHFGQQIPSSRRAVDLAKELGELRIRSEERIAEISRLESQDTLEAREKLAMLNRVLRNEQARATELETLLSEIAAIEVDPTGVKPTLVWYRVEEPQLRDWKEFPSGEVESLAESLTNEFSVALTTHSGISAIRSLINKTVYAEHGDAEDRHELRARLDQLIGLIKDFLGAKLEWDPSGDPMLFGLPVAQAGLSEGQRVLLKIALSLFFQDGTKDELILLMDEPENHLHPLALLQLVDQVREKCPSAQIWIATHSLNLLAHFKPSQIWFVKDGSVESAGNRSLDVLMSLVGGEDGIEELADFMALPAKNAALNFAAQCLTPPSAVDTKPGDPQTTQILKIVSEMAVGNKPLRIVDFGMGKGRMLSELVANIGRETLKEKIDYLGADFFSSDADRSLCISRLAECYEDPEARYFQSSRELIDRINPGSCDLVILCNTLHEIPPEHWLDIFGPDGWVRPKLTDTGYVLVVEDYLMPFGERAHQYGYLVLDEPELRKLFGVLPEDQTFLTVEHNEDRYRGRLKAHLVPAVKVGNVSRDSGRSALECLRDRAIAHLQGIQHQQYSAKLAREYAFWAHQHVNSSLALKSA